MTSATFEKEFTLPRRLPRLQPTLFPGTGQQIIGHIKRSAAFLTGDPNARAKDDS